MLLSLLLDDCAASGNGRTVVRIYGTSTSHYGRPETNGTTDQDRDDQWRGALLASVHSPVQSRFNPPNKFRELDLPSKYEEAGDSLVHHSRWPLRSEPDVAGLPCPTPNMRLLGAVIG